MTEKSKTINFNEAKDAFERQLHESATMLFNRMGLAARLGRSYGGDRDLYTALGYKADPAYKDFLAKYKRQDIAKRIVQAAPKATWRHRPAVIESKEDETDFEKAWSDLVKNQKIFTYLTRADVIAGVGQYGIILLGFDDNKNMSEPVESAKELVYMRPYAEGSAKVDSTVNDAKDPRFGLPEKYKVTTKSETGGLTVHWSRVIHVAEDPFEDDIKGTPRLEAVYNRLQDLDMIAGGSAEMFWRGAFPGYHLKPDPDYTFSQTKTEIEAEIQKYMHDLQRYMKIEGVSIEELQVQVADPSNHFELLISLISASTGIPKRILLGSERGELASTQDLFHWNTRIDERQKDFAEPIVLRPFIDRLIEVKVLPEPTEGYSIEWADLFALSEKEQAEISKVKSESLATYSNSPNAQTIIPPAFFMQKILDLSRDEMDQIDEMMRTMEQEEDDQIDEDLMDEDNIDEA